MRNILLFVLFIPFFSFSQVGEVNVKVVDNNSKQPVSGAKIILSEKFKAFSDFDGVVNFKDVPYGKYTMTITMLSFDTIVKYVKIDRALVSVDIMIGGSLELDEMRVIGNLITDRKTPIPVTRIDPKKIQEELGSRDIPMLLNSTPGVYATQGGGGDGDARITVRGFDQRNIGVMIDGVPVNDMENGAVYWSNWFGLDAITSNIQLQRGLGATKLAMPSIGGTLNIITQGIGGRKGMSFKQELASGAFVRSTLSYNSGLMKNGFGVNVSASYKQGRGWVDGTPTQGLFLYAKLQKKYKNHLISLSVFTAPQQHGQRSFYQRIQYFDSTRAMDLTDTILTNQLYDKGVKFNQHWGYITDENGKRVVKNERYNFYQKPQFTLKDFWQVNRKLSISNIAYMSIGKGGGARLANSTILRDSTGQIDWDQIVHNNKTNTLFNTPNVDPFYHPTEIKSNQVQLASMNNHFWVGYLSQFNYQHSTNLSFAGGLDYRFYRGSHYQVITDLLGGDYFINSADKNSSTSMKKVGDKISINNFSNDRDGIVNWGGAFGQMEYSNSRWTTFVNLSAVYNGYKGIDYFQKKTLSVGDTVLRIGHADTVQYGGQSYDRNSDGLVNFATEWKWVPGFTFKTGAGYTINEESIVFINMGYLSRTPMFSNVIDNTFNRFFANIVNEKILAFESGYSFSRKDFGFNVNGYATNWKNKPIPFGVAIPDPNDPTETIRINLQGMDAIHLGGEIDLAWKISKKISSEFMISYGDWRWNSAKSIYVPEIEDTIFFDAKGVHVGDAAQSVYSVSLRYEPFKNAYVKLQYMFFDRYYAQFDPFSLKGENAGRDAWKTPAYGLLNAFVGYRYKLKKADLIFNGSVTNALNTLHIADANDNFFAPYNFDAQSAAVMFGQGFRFNISIGIQF